jgi:hypothetical protein
MTTNEQFGETFEELKTDDDSWIRIKKMWRINRFQQVRNASKTNETVIKSKPLTGDALPECVWQFRLHPRTIYRNAESVFWTLIQVGRQEIEARCKVRAQTQT